MLASDVKWIKITTDIFDDEKILMIESLPSADSIIVIWFKLLTFAGKQNNDGVFIMNNRIAYTDEMLASVFRRDVNTIRMALKSFEEFGMIDIVDNVITIPNWNKHQTLDTYEQKKAKDRIYQAKRRAAQKALIEKSSDVVRLSDDKSSDVVITDKDIDIDIDKDNNKLTSSGSSSKSKKSVKHKHGEFKNVLLTDTEYQKLCDEYGEMLLNEAITFLDEYIEEKGYKSKSHNLAIKRWVIEAVRNRQTKMAANTVTKPKNSTDDFMNQLQQMYNEEC